MRQEQTYEDDVDENGYRGPPNPSSSASRTRSRISDAR